MTTTGIIIAGIVASYIALAIAFRRRAYVTQYLFFARYSLCGILFLVFFPVVGTTDLAEYCANLFVMSPAELSVLTFTAVVVAWAMMVMLGVTYLSAPPRCKLGFLRLDAPDGSNWACTNPIPLSLDGPWFSTTAGLAVPMIVVSWLRCSGSKLEASGAVLAGACGAALVYFQWHKTSDLLLDIPKRAVEKRAALKRAASTEGDLHVTAPNPALRGAGPLREGNALVSLLLVFVTYGALGVLANPTADNSLSKMIPPLTLFLMLVTCSAMLLSVLAYFLDVIRVPVLLVLVFASYLSYAVGHSNHEVRVSKCTETPRLGIEEAVTVWLKERDPKKYPAPVYVTASGGGIKASFWAATVLAELSRDAHIGDQFPSSIVMLSTVSGGSVGTMYFVDGFDPALHFPKAEIDPTIERAGASSLQAVAWGYAYPDFWRMFLSPIMPNTFDRGWALEERFRNRLRHPNETLDSWRKGIREGWRPIQVFNSTLVESGDRLLMSPLDRNVAVDVGKSAAAGDNPSVPPRLRNFRELYKRYDLSIATAARLSATFPWISPVSRAQISDAPANSRFHMADGGYYDNEGLVTALEGIEETMPLLVREGRRSRVILLRILASPAGDVAASSDGKGWIHSVAGPLLALSNVRTASQRARNDQDVERFQSALKSRDFELVVVTFTLTTAASMSWQLTLSEKTSISAEWAKIVEAAGKGETTGNSALSENARSLRILRSAYTP